MINVPLAEVLRPQSFNEVVGQAHLIGPTGFLTRAIAAKKPLSILFWGPPGCGKTTLAKLYAKAFDAEFLSIHPAFQGIAELKKALQEKEKSPLFTKHLIVFVDEIHRFNKAQQDAFLPFVENGSITLVGATTENPSFSINNALLSRVRVLSLHPLKPEDLKALIYRFIQKYDLKFLSEDCINILIDASQNDARFLLNLLESILLAPKNQTFTRESLLDWIQKKSPAYDKNSDYHYNLISALHKSVRGSDADAALYWLYRMLNAGEDPLYIARRLIRMAFEDIGLADPNAATVAINACEGFQMLGSPEGELCLAQCVVYLSLSPKSNAIYIAAQKAQESAQMFANLAPPQTIINAPTKLMKDLGMGKGYIYDHDTPYGISGQNYFPEAMGKMTYYKPVERGFERDLSKRQKFIQSLQSEQKSDS